MTRAVRHAGHAPAARLLLTLLLLGGPEVAWGGHRLDLILVSPTSQRAGRLAGRSQNRW